MPRRRRSSLRWCRVRSHRASRPFVVLDRDGTLIAERHYLSEPDGVSLLPGVVEGLRAMRRDGLRLVVATNQAGVGRGRFPEARVGEVHQRLEELLAAQGVTLDGIFYCPHHPEAGCDCRKPATGLVRQAVAGLGQGAVPVAVIGDKRATSIWPGRLASPAPGHDGVRSGGAGGGCRAGLRGGFARRSRRRPGSLPARGRCRARASFVSDGLPVTNPGAGRLVAGVFRGGSSVVQSPPWRLPPTVRC